MHKRIKAQYDTITTQADAMTHNGYITVYNPKTSGHETFHIYTDRKSGTRTVSLVSEYLSKSPFATINEDGSWAIMGRIPKIYRAAYEKRLAVLMNPERGRRYGLEYQCAANCRRCNAILTNPDSIMLGIGPCCRAHLDLDRILDRYKALTDNALVGVWRTRFSRAQYEIARIAWACIKNPDLKAALRITA